MHKILLVGVGGFFGSVSRYLLTNLAHKVLPSANLPLGTLLVNIIGCLLIGFLSGLAEYHDLISHELKLLLIIGLLGGFTTFSAFGLESFQFMIKTEHFKTILYLFLHITFGIGAVWLGNYIASILKI